MTYCIIVRDNQNEVVETVGPFKYYENAKAYFDRGGGLSNVDLDLEIATLTSPESWMERLEEECSA
jgi:hypothetical protein